MVVAASSMKLLREVVADENAELVLSAVFCVDLCSDYPLLWALALLGNRVNSSLKAGQVQMPVPLPPKEVVSPSIDGSRGDTLPLEPV